MGAHPVVRRISVQEYLTDPVYAHCEYVAGRPVELNVGGKRHSRIQSRCARKLDEYLDQHPGGYVATELHCKLEVEGEQRFRLPDVAVVFNDTEPDSRYLSGAPDLVVEIRSPDDSFHSLFHKMDEYFAAGARLGWIILPEEQSVIVFAAGSLVRSVGAEETLDGGDVLPGLRIPVPELFS